MSGLDVDARLLALEGTILPHPRYTSALASLVASANRARNPALEGRARIVLGRSGDGKTRLLRALEAQDWAKPTLGGREGDLKPVQYVELPSRLSPRTLVNQIMNAFGENAPSRFNAEEIVDELGHIFRGVGLRMLLLDEAHWLVKSKSQEVQEQNAEFLKSLINRTGVSVILAGTHELDLLNRAFHAQMRRRLLPKVVLEPYRWASTNDRKWFVAILNLYEEALALPSKSNLGTVEIARRLYLVSNGSLGVVVQYLSSALEMLADRNGRSISREDLSNAHQGLNMSKDLVLAGEIDEFLPDKTNSELDPFLCTEAQLIKLWRAAFHTMADDSRKTALKPGRPK